MKLFLFILIPISLLTQVPDYPDTLYLKSGQVHPCNIIEIDESKVKVKYGKDKETTVILESLEKIFVGIYGILYTDESGFHTGNQPPQYYIDLNNMNNISNEKNRSTTSLFNWFITLSNGDVVSIISLQNLVGDTLFISQLGEIIRIPIDSIVEIRNVGESGFAKGAGIGFLAGMGAGILIHTATYEKPKPKSSSFFSGGFEIGPGPEVAAGILGGLAGFLVGGIIGHNSGEDKIFNLSELNHEQKIELIQELISNEKDNQ